MYIKALLYYWNETPTFIHTYFVGADIGVTGELVEAACLMGAACLVPALK